MRDVTNARLTFYITILSVVSAWMLLPQIAIAQIAENNLLEGTLLAYETGMQGIVGRIGNGLLNTFVLLATIEFTWGMIKNYIDNGGLQGFLSEIVTRIMFISFFYYMFLQGTAIPQSVVASFESLASTAVPGTATNFRPDNLVDIGQRFMSASLQVILSGEIIQGLTMLFASVVVLISLVILAAHLAVAILEFYVVGYAGFVLLAFGASRWTHGYAVSYLKYAMSIGMKLFVLYIIAGVVTTQLEAYFVAVNQSSATNVWAIAAFALFSVILAIIAPQSVMGMMSGVSIASGAGAAAAAQTLGSAASAGASAVGGAGKAVGGAVTQTLGAASAGKAAANLGAAAVRSSSSGGGGIGSAASSLGSAAKSAGASAMASAFPVASSIGGRAATRMNAAAKSIKDSNK